MNNLKKTVVTNFGRNFKREYVVEALWCVKKLTFEVVDALVVFDMRNTNLWMPSSTRGSIPGAPLKVTTGKKTMDTLSFCLIFILMSPEISQKAYYSGGVNWLFPGFLALRQLQIRISYIFGLF